MEPSEEATYQVYLLRLWRERPASPGHPAVWRYSVEDTRTRQRRGFGSLEELTNFLRAQVGAGGDEEKGEGNVKRKTSNVKRQT